MKMFCKRGRGISLEYLLQNKNRSDFCIGTVSLAPLVGLEPTTYGLTVRRSTD